MTTVDHFKPNLRDIFFQLFEVLEIHKTSLGKAPFEAMDEQTVRATLEGFLEVMQATWAPAFADGDRIGATFDGKGNVTVPPSYHKALDAYYEGGWNGIELPERLGGYGAPPSYGQPVPPPYGQPPGYGQPPPPTAPPYGQPTPPGSEPPSPSYPPPPSYPPSAGGPPVPPA